MFFFVFVGLLAKNRNWADMARWNSAWFQSWLEVFFSQIIHLIRFKNEPWISSLASIKKVNNKVHFTEDLDTREFAQYVYSKNVQLKSYTLYGIVVSTNVLAPSATSKYIKPNFASLMIIPKLMEKINILKREMEIALFSNLQKHHGTLSNGHCEYSCRTWK